MKVALINGITIKFSVEIEDLLKVIYDIIKILLGPGLPDNDRWNVLAPILEI